jgi:hypothetical protein
MYPRPLIRQSVELGTCFAQPATAGSMLVKAATAADAPNSGRDPAAAYGGSDNMRQSRSRRPISRIAVRSPGVGQRTLAN